MHHQNISDFHHIGCCHFDGRHPDLHKKAKYRACNAHCLFDRCGFVVVALLLLLAVAVAVDMFLQNMLCLHLTPSAKTD